MSFDTKSFYDELDGYYSRCDNAVTEQFLLDALDNVENSMIISAGCSCCSCDSDSCETDGGITAQDKDWIISRSQGIIAILNELACFYRGTSRWPECIDAFTRLKTEMEQCGITGSDNYALVILNLAGAYRLMGDFQKALDTFSESRRILNANGKNDPYSTASLYNNEGLVYLDMKDFARAAEHFEKALEHMRLVPDNDAEIATSLSNAAMAHYGSGNSEKARAMLDEALEIFAALDGGMNPHYAASLNSKALFAFNAGETELAAKTFELAVEKTRLIFGENHEFVIGCRNCAFAYSKLGNTEMSEKYAKMAAEAETRLS